MDNNAVSSIEDTEMAESAECDGETVVTMMDVLQEQQEFEEDANAVLGASDDKECTYSQGYIKRQAIYACLTCCGDAKTDETKRAGVCLACGLNCHENHDLIELYTKRNFRCDCGNPKFSSQPCQFTPNKTNTNSGNSYNQNYSGVYCVCHRPYPDPESTTEDEMIQCIICEDWLHASHLEATVPSNEQYSEMICKLCMEKNEFLHDYSELAVNVDNIEVDIVTVNGKCNGDAEDNGLTNGVEDTDYQTSISDPKIDSIETQSGSPSVDTSNIESTIETEDGNTEENVAEKSDTEMSMDAAIVPEEKSGDNENDHLDTEKVKQASQTSDETPPAETSDKLEKVTDTLDNTTSETNVEPEKTADVSKPEDQAENDETVSKPLCEGDSEINSSNENKDQTQTNEALSEEPKIDEDVSDNQNAKGDSAENQCSENPDDGIPKELTEPENIDTETLAVNENETENKTESTELNPAGAETNKDNTQITTENEEKQTTLNDVEMTDNPEESTSSDVPNLDNESTNDEKGHTEAIDSDTPKDTAIEESTNIDKSHSPVTEKRKLSTEDSTDNCIKKPKLVENCKRPKGGKKIYKGATFWPSSFRQKLCTCSVCDAMYRDLSVLFLIDPEDTVSAYETLGKEKSNGQPTQYEKGLQALSSLDRIQQINALTEYNKMRDKLLDFLKSFKDRKEVVKEEDIKAFFAGMKPKREPDGVYFCR